MNQKHQYYIILVLITMFISRGVAQTIYVDNKLAYNCYGNYSLANRDSSGCDGIAFKSLREAAEIASEGMVVKIREGIYNEQLAPVNSGGNENYLVFQNYMNEEVVISGNDLSPAVFFNQNNYIIIDGIVVKDVYRWLNALGCDHLIIRNCTFKNANNSGGSSKTGVFLQSCNYCKILNNIMDSTTQDNLALIDSDYNLIEGNVITRARHTLWTLKCSNRNVLRKNYFHNAFQKIGEIYDCDEVGFGSEEFPKISSFDDSKFNVVEGNTFAYTSPMENRSPYSGIQFAGQNCIIRKNIFYHCYGPPISLTTYKKEAEYNYNNTIYNNVFYNNHFGGISVSRSSLDKHYGHQVVNNIFYGNNFEQHDFRWEWYNGLNGKPVQVFIKSADNVCFRHNNIFSRRQDASYLIAYGSRNLDSNPEPKTIAWWESNYPALFQGTLQENPMFLSKNSFSLKESSPMVDAGAFLAQTVGSGTNSITMIIDNASYFITGFGIIEGDIIQIEGQAQTSEIKSIDYKKNILTLSNPLSWQHGRGVSLKYVGTAPDIGVDEFGRKNSK